MMLLITRCNMKESFYFSHDFNAHDDGKIKKLLRKHGARGYGIYWYLIELLASETEKWYLSKDYEEIAFFMREECDRIKSVIEDFGLFELDDKNFWNKRLDKHFDQRAEKSKKARDNARKRWDKQKKKNAVALPLQCEPNAIKERKGKKKNIKKKIFIAPTIEEFQNYIDENGYDLDGENIFKGYEINNWKDSRDKPIKNWKQKLRQVWFKPESKKKNDSEKSDYDLIKEFNSIGFSKFKAKYGLDKADLIGNMITK